MIKKPKIAILLEFGFHEIKKYIHSGFANELSKDFDIVWFAIDKGSKEFHDYFTSTGFPLIYFDEKKFISSSTKIEQYNQSIRRNWIASNKLGGFHNHNQVRSKNLKSTLIGNWVAKSMFEEITLKNVQKNYYSTTIKKGLLKHSIDLLFLTGYNSTFSKSFVITGALMNKKVHFLANSWKDLYINNFVPFKSLSTLFVWSEQMVVDFKYHMPYLNKANFVVSGNPTFDILLDVKPNKNRLSYAEKYNISINAKWLLYTMMPVSLVKDEIETIQFIAKELFKQNSKEEYVLLVRKNPTHNEEDFKKIDLPENLIITDHYCTFDREKDMIVQSIEGEKEWIDLLQHSELNISVPSTVTLEFLTLKKPVLNIEFNSQNLIDIKINQFFEAGFYKPLFKSHMVFRCKNVSELINNIEKLIHSKSHFKSEKEIKSMAGKIICETLVKSLSTK